MDVFEARRHALQRLIDSKFEGNRAEFARLAKLSPSYVTRMLENDADKARKRIGEDMARELEAIPELGLRPGALLSPSAERGNVVELSDSPRAAARRGPADVNIAHFETGGSMGTGVVLRDQPGVIQSWRVTREWIEKNVRSFTSTENLCIVTGFGDSMRPLFNPGDPLLVDVGVRSVEFDAVYFFRVNDEGFIKRVQRIPEGNTIVLRAHSANREHYEPFSITADMDFEVLGRVLKVWKGEEF